MADGDADVPEMLGQSPAMAAVRTQAETLAREQWATGSSPPVLIRGETGTGKDLLAAHLHRAGPRARGPFIDVQLYAPGDIFDHTGRLLDLRATGSAFGDMARGGTLHVVELGILYKADRDRFWRAVATTDAFVIVSTCASRTLR